jgi:hypothetical protein
MSIENLKTFGKACHPLPQLPYHQSVKRSVQRNNSLLGQDGGIASLAGWTIDLLGLLCSLLSLLATYVGLLAG